MSNTCPVTSDRKDAATGEAQSGHGSRVPRHPPAFTLIEIMIVVAILGLVAAMGVPSILQSLRKDGMRKAVSDVKDALDNARSRAIFSGQNTEVVFHPLERSIGSTVLPNGVDIAMLDINLLDYGCDVQEAIDMPRGLHYDGHYQLEDGVPAQIVAGLEQLGHRTTPVASPLGWVAGGRTRPVRPAPCGCTGSR